MYTISKEFNFCASHRLACLPEGHPCTKWHGHNYSIILEFQSETLDEAGMVVDYRQLKPVGEMIDNLFDHQELNDKMDLNPTAENISAFLYKKITETFPELPKLKAVTVKETEKTAARYEE